MTNKKLPKCEEYGLCTTPCIKCGLICCSTSETEQALTQAENKGLENGKRIRKYEQKNIREKRIQGERSIKRGEIIILQESNEKQKDRNVQFEMELGEQVGRLNVCEEKSMAYERQLNKAERILNCATHHFTHRLKTCCVEAEILQLEEKLKTAKQDGAKAERERILKRLDDADCQCCGDTERIKVELMK